MPERHEHLQRARDNELLAAQLKADVGFSNDWAITMLFYSALHYVDAFLAGKRMHPLNHDDRDEEIERNGSLTDIYRHYRRLKDFSRSARYEIANYAKADVHLARTKLEAIKNHLGL